MTITVSDSFNRTASTTLGNTDSAYGGTSRAWVVLTTDGTQYGVDSNGYLYSPNANGLSAKSSAHFDASSADGKIKAKLITKGGTDQPKLAARIQDQNNQIVFSATTSGYDCYYYQAGSSTSILTSSVTPQANDIMEMKIVGNTVTCYINGTQIGTGTAPSFLNGVTKWGVNLYKYPNARFDDVIFDDLSVSGTAYTKSLSDAITSAETFAKQFTGYKSLSDSVPSSDSVSRQFTARKTVTDSITSSDSISKRFTATIIDSIATGEAENEQSSKLLNETISSADSVSSTKGNAVNLSDSIAITETIRKALAKIQSDSISSTDVDSETINRRLNDVIASTDSISTFKGKTVTLSDSITLTDALNKSISSLKIDSVGLSESFGKTSAVSVRVYDVIISSDHVDTFLPNVPTYNEVISLTLEIAQGQTVNLAIVERGNYELDVVERKTIDIKL
jgi:hypothetical protein